MLISFVALVTFGRVSRRLFVWKIFRIFLSDLNIVIIQQLVLVRWPTKDWHAAAFSGRGHLRPP
jgi:hypothetical protein